MSAIAIGSQVDATRYALAINACLAILKGAIAGCRTHQRRVKKGRGQRRNRRNRGSRG